MLTVSMHRYGADETLRVIIDDLQTELHCCGADGFSDWTRIFWTGNATVTSRRHVAVPRSCCDRAAGYSRCVSSAPGDLPELLTAYKRGCNTVLRQHLRYMVHLPPQDICPQVLKILTVKVKVAHTRLPSGGFRSRSRFLAVSLQVTRVINPAVGCHYFSPGLQLPSQPSRGLLPVSLLGEQKHDGCEQFA